MGLTTTIAQTIISAVLIGTILACLLLAVATDFRNRVIPNRLVLVVLGCGLCLRLLSGLVPLLASVSSAIAVLATLGVLATYDLTGWGDVKLIAAVTLMVPAAHVLMLLLTITLAGGLLGCFYLAVSFALQRIARSLHTPPESGPTSKLRRLAERERTRILGGEPMPYAFAVLGGVIYQLTFVV